MGQSTGILVIANLTPTLLGQLGYGVVLQLGLSVVWTVCALLGCFVNAALMDRLGRIKLLGKRSVLHRVTMLLHTDIYNGYQKTH